LQRGLGRIDRIMSALRMGAQKQLTPSRRMQLGALVRDVLAARSDLEGIEVVLVCCWRWAGARTCR
jgi:hypothetical protein